MKKTAIQMQPMKAVVPTQDFDKKFREALELNVPSFEISQELRGAMLIAMEEASPMSLGITGTAMEAIYLKLRKEDDLNMYEYACASNNVELQSAKRLGVCMSKYFDLMKEVQFNSAKWNEETEDIRNSVIQSLAQKQLKEKN